MLTVEKRPVDSDLAVLSLAGRLTLGHDCQRVAIDGRGWLNAPLISALTGFRPLRAVYTYMNRLRR